MHFKCKLKLKPDEDFDDSDVMLLKTSKKNGFLIVHKINQKMGPKIYIFKVVGGNIFLIDNKYDLHERKRLIHPKCLLTLDAVRGMLLLKNADTAGCYEIVDSSDEIKEADLSNFTPINKTDLSNLEYLYPKLNLDNVVIYFMSQGVTASLKSEVNFNNITRLFLNSSGLSSIPKQIRFLRHLRTLSATFNWIEKLDDKLFNSNSGLNATLRYLHLNNNQIRKLPLSFFSLKMIKEVNLHNNHLKYLSDEIKCLTKLQQLFIQSNQLTCLPSGVLKLTDLKMCKFLENPLYKFGNQPIHIQSKYNDIPSLYGMSFNVAYRNGLLSDLSNLVKLHRCVDEKQICSCGDMIFNESRKAMVQVNRPALSSETRLGFYPETFPVQVVSCSKRCFLNEMQEVTEEEYFEV